MPLPLRVGKRHELEDGYIFILEDKTENLNCSEGDNESKNLALNQINHELGLNFFTVFHIISGGQ